MSADEKTAPCKTACTYGECRAPGSYQGCGGCCGCLGGCQVQYEIVTANPRGIPSGPAAIHFCPVPGCPDIWESEATCKHAAWIPEPTAEYRAARMAERPAPEPHDTTDTTKETAAAAREEQR